MAGDDDKNAGGARPGGAGDKPAQPGEASQPPLASRPAREDNGVETAAIKDFDIGKGLLLAGGTLALAAVAVGLFILLANAVGCQYQSAVFSIFAAVILAAFGGVLGGRAGVRTRIDKLGTVFSVGGGAAFLLIVMGVVYWATNSPCEFTPSVRLISIPHEIAVSGDTLAQAPVHMRVRFHRDLDVQDDLDNDHAYNIHMKQRGGLTTCGAHQGGFFAQGLLDFDHQTI
jgi:hypothetical protein